MGLLEDFGSKSATKAANLSTSKETKLLELFGQSALTPSTPDATYDNTGHQSAAQLQQALSDQVDSQIYTAPDGSQYQEKYGKDAHGNTTITKVPYYGPERNLYIDSTKQGNMKLGLASTAKGGFDARYDPSKGGWSPGPQGVTPQDGALMDITLPWQQATKFEHDVHSNIGQIRNRAIGQGPVTQADVNAFGSGKTEYTTQNAPLWNSGYVDPRTPLLKGTPLPKPMDSYKPKNRELTLAEKYAENERLNGSSSNPVLNIAKAAIAGGLNTSSKLAQTAAHGLEVASDVAAFGHKNAVTDLFKAIQQEQETARKNGTFDKFVGYDPSKVQKMGAKFADDVQRGEYVKAMVNVFSNPEAMATAFMNSVPEMAAMWTPVGLGVMATANANSAVYNLRESAKAQGRETTVGEEATAIGVSVVGTFLDRLGDKVMMGATKVPAKFKDSLTKTISAMAPDVKNEVFKAYGKALGKIGLTGAEFLGKANVEGITEYGQTILEGKASDVNKLNTNLTDEEHRQGLEAYGVGMGAGGIGAGATMTPGVVSGINQTGGALMDALTPEARKNALASGIEGSAGSKISAEMKSTIDSMSPEHKEQASNLYSEIRDAKTAMKDLDPASTEYQEAQAKVDDLVQQRQSIIEQYVPTEIQESADLLNRYDKALAKTDLEPEIRSQLVEAQKEQAEAFDTGVKNFEANLRESGIQEDAIQEHVNAAKKRFNRLGIANLTSLTDRASKVTVDVLDNVVPREMSQKKEKLFDPYDMTDEQVSQVINEGFDTGSKDTFLKRVAKKLGYDTKQHQKVQEMSKHIEANMDKIQGSMAKVLPQGEAVTPANVMRVVALGMSNIKSAMTSEADIASKQDLDRVTNAARKPQLDVQIGKAYFNSFGFKLGGKPEDTAKAYKEMGDNLIQIMKDLGLVEEGIESLSAHNMVDSKGKPLTEESAKEMGLRTKKTKQGKLLIEMPTLVLTGDTKVGARKSENKMADALSTFAKLFTPPNMELPQQGGQESVVMSKGAEDVKISKEHANIIKQYSNLKYKIKPEFMQILKDLRELKDTRFNGDFDAMLKAKPEIKQLLNLTDSRTEFLRMKESGRKINKTGNLARLLDNLDALEGDFNFHYESAINERIHVLQTILDYQGDKFMSRQILTGGEYTTGSEKELQLLVEDVADALGVTAEEVLNPTGILKKAVASMAKRDGVLSLSDMLTVAKGMKSSTPFKTLSAVRAVYDISQRKGNSVTTNYMVESDATASGVVNTLMNLAGYPKVQALLQKLGIGKNADLVNKMDPYLIVNEYIDDVYTKENELTYNEEIKPVVDRLTDILSNPKDPSAVKKFLRNIAKYPIMTWFYGQTGENTKTFMGRELAVDLIEAAINGNYKALDYINEIAGTKYAPDRIDLNGQPTTEIGDISKADVRKITEHFASTVGSMYVESMENLFADVEKYRQSMGDIFKLLDSIPEWEGTIKSAMGTMVGTNEKMSIQKLKSMTMKDIDNNLLMINQMMNNKTSFNVNLQHATDAALLLMTLKDVMKDSGIMTVHDAFYSDTATAQKIMESYNQYAVKAAKEYDYLSTAIQEAEKMISKMPEGVAKNKALGKLESIKENYAPFQKSKEEFLGEIPSVDVLGNNLWTGEELSTEEAQEIKKSEPVEQANNRVKSTFESALRVMKNTNIPIKERIRTFLDKVEIPSTHQDLAIKIQNALDDSMVSFKTGKKYQAMPWEVFVDTGSDFDIDARYETPFTLEGVIETMAHEIDHAYQMAYIENQLSKGTKASTEIKYLQKVLTAMKTKAGFAENLQGLSFDALDRINYITTRSNEFEQLAEMIAIMNNEKAVMDEIAAFVSSKSLADVVKGIVQKIKDFVANLLPEQRQKIIEKAFAEDSIRTEAIYSAIKQLDDNAWVNTDFATLSGTKVKPLGIAQSNDIYEDMYMSPYKYANEVVAKTNAYLSDYMIIFGNATIEASAPYLRKAHIIAKRNSTLYAKTVSLLRTGLYDSELAQKLHQALGINGDSKRELLDNLQTMFTSIMQESQTELEYMSKLDRQLQKLYPSKAEQKLLYDTFAKSGIGNLVEDKVVYDGLINGTMTLADALKTVSVGMDPVHLSELDKVAEYYITGNVTNGMVNPFLTSRNHRNAELYTTLKALELTPGSIKLIQDMQPIIRQELIHLARINKSLNDEVNLRGSFAGKMHTPDAQYYGAYDGNYVMDVHNKVYEYRMIDLRDARSSQFAEAQDWKVIKAPTKDTLGIVARENLNGANVPGVGLNTNRFNNGVFLNPEQSQQLWMKLKDMKVADRQAFLDKNQIIQEGNRFRFVIDEKTKAEKLSLVQNVAHSLYRTKIHNQELIQSQSIRDVVLSQGLLTIKTEEDLAKLEELLKFNDKEGLRGDRKPVLPFIKIEMDFTYNELPPMVRKYFKSPRNLSTYNDFNKKVDLVKKGEADVLLGHQTFSLFGDSEHRELAKLEAIYKKMIILAKQKMVVTNPVKLAMDLASNLGILQMKDMTPFEIWDGFKDGWTSYHEMSKLRGDLVALQMMSRIDPSPANLKAVEDKVNEIKAHDFYDAFQAGFVQSYSTDLVIKEFDTISGIQKDIDDVFDKMTKDKRGNPNKLHKAIKWWQQLGGDKLSVDGWLRAASKLSKINGTSVGEEMLAIADRLKSKKDADSVARYLSEIIGAPSSEIVTYGGATMVLSDALSKYTLAKFLLGRKNPKTKKPYTKEEAYQEANDTFVDYRYNLPAEIKTLSDYGILMFPAFWMKIQKTIASLIKYHPINSLGGYAVESYLGVQQVNILNEAFPFKWEEGSIINDPTSVVGPEAVFALGGMI